MGKPTYKTKPTHDGFDIYRNREYVASAREPEIAKAIIDTERRRDEKRGRERELRRLRTALGI